MKHLLLFFLTTLLTGFSVKHQPADSFTIHILYTGLPSGIHYEYFLSQQVLTLRKYAHGIPDRPEIELDKARFKLKSIDSLAAYVFRTDWSKLPTYTKNGCIDGYHYALTIISSKDTFNFKVGCPGQTDLNKVLDLCNQAIPNKKYRKKFKLGHGN